MRRITAIIARGVAAMVVIVALSGCVGYKRSVRKPAIAVDLVLVAAGIVEAALHPDDHTSGGGIAPSKPLVYISLLTVPGVVGLVMTAVKIHRQRPRPLRIPEPPPPTSVCFSTQAIGSVARVTNCYTSAEHCERYRAAALENRARFAMISDCRGHR